MTCLTATPQSPALKAFRRDKQFSKEREFPVIPSTHIPRGLPTAPDWGSLPWVLPTLPQGSTSMGARRLCGTSNATFPQEKELRWEKVTQLLTPAVTAIVVRATLRDPLGGNAAPPAAWFLSSEGGPQRGRPGRPQQGVAVKQKSVS